MDGRTDGRTERRLKRRAARDLKGNKERNKKEQKNLMMIIQKNCSSGGLRSGDLEYVPPFLMSLLFYRIERRFSESTRASLNMRVNVWLRVCIFFSSFDLIYSNALSYVLFL